MFWSGNKDIRKTGVAEMVEKSVVGFVDDVKHILD